MDCCKESEPGSRFTFAGVAESAAAALELAAASKPGVIVLDHGLSGPLSGSDAAPRLKALAPLTKIILFTAYAELQNKAESEPAIDAFLVKNQSTKLLPLAQKLTGLAP